MKKLFPQAILALAVACAFVPQNAYGTELRDEFTANIIVEKNVVDDKTLSDPYEISPFTTFYGNGGTCNLTKIGNTGQVYWNVNPNTIGSFSYDITLTCRNNRTGESQSEYRSGTGGDIAEGNVMFSVSDGNTYTVTISGHAIGAPFGVYHIPAGSYISFYITF